MKRSIRSVHRILGAALLLPIILNTVGCSTTSVTEANRTVIVGRVYDEDGNPVAGALVETGRFHAVSDGTGRFRIDAVPQGERRLTTSQEQHETAFTTVILQSPYAFAQTTLWSLSGLLDQAIMYLRIDAETEARNVYERAIGIDPSDERVRLLGEIVGAE